MSWEQIVQKSSKMLTEHNATDGDLYIAYALIVKPQNSGQVRKTVSNAV